MRSSLWLLLAFSLMIACSVPVNAETATAKSILLEPTDSARKRVVPIKIYLAADTEASAPVILFSHGLGGSRMNNGYLGNFWADAGYTCVFMQHAGSDESVWKSASFGGRFTALKKAASGQSSRDRFADVSFVIDQLTRWNQQAGHPLFQKLDLDHIGMCGHSFGAATTLGAAGRWFPFQRKFDEPRIDAFLPMSPQPGKGITPEKAFGDLKKPLLCMTGTLDGSPIDKNMQPSSRQKVYAAVPPGDKYQLVLKDAEHHAFGDGGRRRKRNPHHHPAIQKISLRFWDAYLKEDTSAKAWLQSQKPIEETPLESADRWQWK